MVRLPDAAKELAKQGIKAELIDLRTIKPLDIATVANSVRKTHHCVFVEEGHVFDGIAAEVGFEIMEHCFDFLDAADRACLSTGNSRCPTLKPWKGKQCLL